MVAGSGRDRDAGRITHEPRPNWPYRRGAGRDKFRLAVSYFEGRKHLPVIELRRAA